MSYPFNPKTFTNKSMQLVSTRSSNCVDCMAVDLLRGSVSLTYHNGYGYCYYNVSRRAIANLLLNPNMSLGFWVNKNCVEAKRAKVNGSYHYAY